MTHGGGQLGKLLREANIKQQQEYERLLRLDPELENREAMRLREWRSRHPNYPVRHHAVHRARTNRRIKRATPPWSTQDSSNAYGNCYVESRRLTESTGIQYSVDHTHPLVGMNTFGQRVSSGLHVPWNFQVMTMEDNDRKGSRLPPGSGFEEPLTSYQLAILAEFLKCNPE